MATRDATHASELDADLDDFSAHARTDSAPPGLAPAAAGAPDTLQRSALAHAANAPIRAAALLRTQQTHGNRAVQRSVAPIQAKECECGGACEECQADAARRVQTKLSPGGAARGVQRQAARVLPGAGQGIGSIDRDAMRDPSGPLTGPGSQPPANQAVDHTAITRAATALLDESIGRISNVLALVRQNIELTGRADVLRQAFPDVDDALPFAGIDRNAPSAWTGSGPRTVGLLLERLQTVRDLLGSGSIHYQTPERDSTVSHCGHIGKPAALCAMADDPYAWACRGTFFVLLCPAFVEADENEQMLTLIHEAAHLAYPDLKHSARINLDNAFCIEMVVGTLTKTYSIEALARCQVPDVPRPPD